MAENYLRYDEIIFWVSVYLWHSFNNDKNLGQTDATVLQLAHYFLDKVIYYSLTIATILARYLVTR